MGMNCFLMSSSKYIYWNAIINLVTISGFGNHILIFLSTWRTDINSRTSKKSEE